MEVWLLDDDAGGDAEEAAEEATAFPTPVTEADDVDGANTNSFALGLKTKALALGFK